MSERHEVQAGPVVKVARDLRVIEDYYEALLMQAINDANDRLMPGGESMVARAGVADLGEWAEQIAAAEWQHLAKCDRLDHSRCRFAEHVVDEDDESREPPLQTLLFWSEQWRDLAGYSLDRRPTLTTEVNFIRGNLDWAWENLVEWDDFAADIKRARTRVENLLMLGARVAFTGAPCLYDECKGARLVRKTVPARGQNGEKVWRLTDWHCPKCKRSWDEPRYASMVTAATESTHYEQFGGDSWCSIDRAAQRVERPRLTVWSWADRLQVRTVCRVSDQRIFVHVEDARQRDLLAKARHAARLASALAKRTTTV